jgi:ABC-type multidrug transport system fused ATPase/permease subunit
MSNLTVYLLLTFLFTLTTGAFYALLFGSWWVFLGGFGLLVIVLTLSESLGEIKARQKLEEKLIKAYSFKKDGQVNNLVGRLNSDIDLLDLPEEVKGRIKSAI